MRALACLLLLVVAVTACDGRPSSTLDLLGVAEPPRWSREDCAPTSDATILEVPSERWWRCRVPRLRARLRVDWWRGTAVEGERHWLFPDSVKWERFQDSLATAMGRVATLERCTIPSWRDTDPMTLKPRTRVWAMKGERRWVAVNALWVKTWPGSVSVRTGPGAVEACADSLRQREIVVE